MVGWRESTLSRQSIINPLDQLTRITAAEPDRVPQTNRKQIASETRRFPLHFQLNPLLSLLSTDDKRKQKHFAQKRRSETKATSEMTTRLRLSLASRSFDRGTEDWIYWKLDHPYFSWRDAWTWPRRRSHPHRLDSFLFFWILIYGFVCVCARDVSGSAHVDHRFHWVGFFFFLSQDSIWFTTSRLLTFTVDTGFWIGISECSTVLFWLK